jgi:restriction system protein
MLPLLNFAADGREHNQREAKDALSRHFNITESDRREMLPSGRQTRFDNRIAWANVYLRKAGFLEMAIRSSASFTDHQGKTRITMIQALKQIEPHERSWMPAIRR